MYTESEVNRAPQLRGQARSVNLPPKYVRHTSKADAVVSFVVDADGQVKSPKIVSSTGYQGLDKQALDTVERWRFSPGRLKGETVAVRIERPVEFRRR
ncbi:energy transducer TonB [Ferrimonas pelagia]|uniref:TonB C-terminal domain-containing protein n=1 Tax=Ferrimonas pelagia TaxID=1177826 RepID=A0ABP9EPC2_9GAMM